MQSYPYYFRRYSTAPDLYQVYADTALQSRRSSTLMLLKSVYTWLRSDKTIDEAI